MSIKEGDVVSHVYSPNSRGVVEEIDSFAVWVKWDGMKDAAPYEEMYLREVRSVA